MTFKFKVLSKGINSEEEAPTGRFSKDDDTGSLSLFSITGASGISWEKNGNEPLDGWLYGTLEDGRAKFTAYIYSDLRTAYVGNFEGKMMVEAKATRISQARYYRVSQKVSDLGWVDLDLTYSTILLGQ